MGTSVRAYRAAVKAAMACPKGWEAAFDAVCPKEVLERFLKVHARWQCWLRTRGIPFWEYWATVGKEVPIELRTYVKK